jgi:hypothetical protein
MRKKCPVPASVHVNPPAERSPSCVDQPTNHTRYAERATSCGQRAIDFKCGSCLILAHGDAIDAGLPHPVGRPVTDSPTRNSHLFSTHHYQLTVAAHTVTILVALMLCQSCTSDVSSVLGRRCPIHEDVRVIRENMRVVRVGRVSRTS